MSIGIRGFTIGYDYYAPERSVCFHHYATGNNAKVRNKVSKTIVVSIDGPFLSPCKSQHLIYFSGTSLLGACT
jgi:hypothetical protein